MSIDSKSLASISFSCLSYCQKIRWFSANLDIAENVKICYLVHIILIVCVY